ncbi:DENN domain-containing protein 3-like [Protopterus annectens]|uniref:DENN domain-containing protein 3-like n=1 Tax=Protopterus annectens TaxID=7888 RepID=UPI001CFAE84D|nr:DENN domain-containing protein 3-like [Protopterus annectens]
MADILPLGLLEICVVVGASKERLKEAYQVAQNGDTAKVPSLEPEVLSVFLPPFVTKEDNTSVHVNQNAFNRNQTRHSFKTNKKDKPSSITASTNTDHKEPVTEDASVPKDIDLLGLPQLCFPGGLYISRELQEDHFHFLVLTDVIGNRTYGIVAQCYRSLKEGYYLPNGQLSWNSSQTAKVYGPYAPVAVCVISKFPYYNAFKDFLSCLLLQLKSCKDFDLDDQVKKFAARLSLIPCPPPGPLHLVIHMKPLEIMLPPREDLGSPIVDLDLHLPFLCFKPEQVLQIITCILTEQRIVLFSSDWALLTIVAECFMLYLHPLQWQHTFVPILSSQMLDFVMAPTSFLMGCHIDHFREVDEKGEDLVLINIDSGEIGFSESGTGAEIPDVPSDAAVVFLSRIESLPMHYDLEKSHLSSSTTLADARMRRIVWQQHLNWEIQQITLQLIVNIFRDVLDHLNYEYRVFNSEEFIKTRSQKDQPFYRKVLESYIFHSFLKARLSKRMDAFSRMEMNTQSEMQRMKQMLDSPRRPTMEEMIAWKQIRPDLRSSRRMVRSLPNLHDDRIQEFRFKQLSLRKSQPETVVRLPSKSVYTFLLPEVHSALNYRSIQLYYAEFVSLLSKSVSSIPPENSGLLARYYYLRGLMYMMQGKRLEALFDFQHLYKTDVGIFPADLVKKVVDSMTSEERFNAERKPELKRLISQVKEDHIAGTKIDDHVKNFVLPQKHMHLEDFVKRIQESGIVKDIQTIHRLFEALTVGRSECDCQGTDIQHSDPDSNSVFYVSHQQSGQQKQIDPETFKGFYTYWKKTEEQAQDVDLPPEVIEHLDKNESVYKVSSPVKTNYEVGRIAMTQKRLFLLTEGRPGYKDIAKFRDIEDVKATSVNILFLRIPTLQIKSISKKDVFEANLKSECDLWHQIVKEMWAGRKMSDDHKDPQYIQQALTNVLLMDAVVGCFQSPKAIYAATKLSYFDRMKNEVQEIVPKTTAETLKHKINPSFGQTIPQAVDVLLCTPGYLNASEKDEGAHSKLWCGLRDGKVVVFDAATWSFVQHSIQVSSSKLNCMLGIEQTQVWVGSQDFVIYIINTCSMSCNKQLTDHRSEVMDLTIDEKTSKNSQRQAYSCSLDGTVIIWDVSTLKVKHHFQVPCKKMSSFKLYNNMLWCCTGDSLVEVRRNGIPCRTVKLSDNLKDSISTFSCFLLVSGKDQLWVASADKAELYIWNLKSHTLPPQKLSLQDCHGIHCMIKVKSQVWVGCTGISQGKLKGKIYVVDMEKYSVEKELVAHLDTVTSLCSAEDRYVLSGSGKEDGKIAIWKVE